MVLLREHPRDLSWGGTSEDAYEVLRVRIANDRRRANRALLYFQTPDGAAAALACHASGKIPQ